jgi:hypothetical protein
MPSLAPRICNWIVAASNVAVLLPLLAPRVTTGTAVVLVMAAVASTAYHLAECHKHGLCGWGDPRLSRRLLQVDRAAATVAVLWLVAAVYTSLIRVPRAFAYQSLVWLGGIAVYAVVALACLAVSELLPPGRWHPYAFTVAHSLWHILAFFTARLVIQSNHNIKFIF